MHFIFLTLGYHPDQVGGAYRYVTEVAERLATRKHRVQAIYPGPPGEPSLVGRRGEVELFRYLNPRGFFWSNWLRENRAVRSRWQELAGAANEAAPAFTVLCHAYFGRAFQSCRGRSAFLFTGPWAEEYRFARQSQRSSWPRRLLDRALIAGMRRVERRALQHVDRILTLSHYYETQLPQWHGAGLPPVKVISGGVNAEQFRPLAGRAAVREEFGLAPDRFLFLTVRRLDPRMGLLTLVDGFARVAGEFPGTQLWLAGTGPQRSQLQDRIAQQQLDRQVKLLGFVPEADLPALLNAADCVLVPSLDLEGFGLATVEALACGAPVLGSRAGATQELLASLSATLLFDAGSAEALAAKLRQVLRDPSSLPGRQQCCDYAVKQFSWDRVASAFEATCAELASGGGGA